MICNKWWMHYIVVELFHNVDVATNLQSSVTVDFLQKIFKLHHIISFNPRTWGRCWMNLMSCSNHLCLMVHAFLGWKTWCHWPIGRNSSFSWDLEKELLCRYVLGLFYREHTITTFKELDSNVRGLFRFYRVVLFWVEFFNLPWLAISGSSRLA